MKQHSTSIAALAFLMVTFATWHLHAQQSSQRKQPLSTAGQVVELRVGNAAVQARPLTQAQPANICGVAVDPRFPEFELYTFKVVLFRVSCLQALAEPRCRQELIDVANAQPYAIVLIPTRTEPVPAAVPTLNVPVLAIAPQDSAAVISAAADRRQISILIH